ncbi:MAG: ATP synthase F1 subunit gamma [Planctomycetota bacterium]|jgi:F-type H+-transporting ATPase subunit gamma
MANLKDIKRRIRSVKGTQQITRAMKMVAAAKLRRNQDALVRLRPFTDGVATLLARFLPQSIGDEHPLLVRRDPVRGRMMVVLTGDKGLCGAFNQNLIRHAQDVERECAACPLSIMTIGRKGYMFYRKRGVEVARHWEDIYDKLSFITAQTISNHIEEAFVSGRADEVLLVYNHFVSPIEQHVRSYSVLPLDVSNIRESAAAGSRAPREIEIPAEDERLVYLFEPDIISLCNDLLSRYLASELFRAMLENVASEFGARMTAMDSATENASDLISRLTLMYNRARQASITKEILEVAGGAEAMKESV